LISGQLDEIAPGIRRLVANNASYLTGPGTNTYLIGRESHIVLDPGPIDALHVERILTATARKISAVLVTHTHRDHSPAAAMLADITGARLLGRPPPDDSHQDTTFTPSTLLSDGDEVEIDGLRLRAVHTPGHASNHLCYVIDDMGLIFTGDHLMQGSTVVIAPPDGNMRQYLQSLHRLREEPVSRIAPGHGSTIEDAQAEIARIVAHRLQREAKVIACLAAAGIAGIDGLLSSVYADVDPSLHALARSSLLAHLIKLEEEGHACRTADGNWQCRN